jgi:ribosomal protein L20A (L18A)
VLDHELTDKLLSLPASTASIDVTAPKQLVDQVEHQRQVKLTQALADNDRFFQREREKLEQWAEDRLLMAEKALEDVKIKLQSLKRLSRQAISIEEVQQLQDQIKATEREQRKMRQEIFDVEDEIETRRDALIDALKQRLHRASRFEQLFMIRWTLV